MATKRENWSSWLDYFLSIIGCLVGLSNIWRFPYVCFQSGSAAFLIPYFVAMFVCAMPAILLEVLYCQYSNLGPGRVWIICPLFQGIGYGMVVLTAIVSVYYNVILAWTLYYLVQSFSSVLPWSTCGNEWNTDLCQSATNQTHSSLLANESSYLSASSGRVNVTTLSTNSTIQMVSSSEEYWSNHVLQMSSGIGEAGSVRWQLLLCLLGAWLIVFLSLIKGIKSSGKVVYVAATVPYLILIALLIRGLLLPGAVEGIRYYVIPQWEKLLDIKVWRNAAAQVFFSVGIGWGGISTLASYNRFHNNCYRDALVIPVVNCLTSLFAGFIIFVFLGYMANQSNPPISAVVKEGPGLAFLVYPDAVATMPVSQLWSVLFFLMLFLVGMDSQFVHVQTIVCAITDAFPRSLGHRKLPITAIVCGVGFLLGFSCVTQVSYVQPYTNTPLLRDALVIPVVNCLTSLFAGFIIFVFLGYMANQSNPPISAVVKEGPGLAFLVYPDAVATMPVSQLWSVLFFLMLFLVGMDSQFVHVQTIVCAITDAFPRSLGHRKLPITAIVCGVGFLLGFSCVTQGGIYVLTLMDWYIGSISVMVLAMSEMLVLAWIYGVNRLYDDLTMMIGYRVSPVWKPMWLVVTPLLVFTLLIAGLINFSPVTLGGTGYPAWAQSIGWIIATCPVLPIPFGMAFAIWKEQGTTLKERLINTTKPRKEWRPALDETLTNYEIKETTADVLLDKSCT